MSIFSEDNKVSGSWIKFQKVGDSFEGTLVDKREVPNRLKPGTMQTVYEFLKDGEIFIYGSKPAVDVQLKHVNLGQVVGLKFEKEVPPKTPGYSATKVIQVYASKDVVDETWLTENDVKKAFGDGSETSATAEELPVIQQEPDFSVEGEKLEKINTLAKEKLGAKDDEDVKQKVMEATKLAFMPMNYDQILEFLTK